nr:Leucine-responsive regulatory protein [Klebsiella pneumoniae]
MYNIDDYDLKILTLLQANGRLTNQELSELIGLSASQCSRRRIALEQAQLILGYHARLAPDAAGQEMLGLIEVRLLNHTRNAWRAFIRCSVKWTPFWTPGKPPATPIICCG